MKCPDCPHAEHEFMFCQTEGCQCSKRYPSFCSNSIVDALAAREEKQ